MAPDSATVLPHRTVLEDAVPRSLAFLRGVGTSPILRSILNNVGYSDEEHQIGWSLIHKASGYAPERQPLAPDADTAVREAVLQLDAWDEPNFALADAALSRRFPAQRDFLFHNLEPAQGAAAIVTVSTFLDRVDALEKGEGRKATHKEDLAAVALLAKRGINKDERHRLRGLVKVAQQGTEAAELPVPDEEARSAHEAALVELYQWHKDWATTTKTVIRRRDYLIRLGLARRKSRAGAAPEDPNDDGKGKGPQ